MLARTNHCLLQRSKVILFVSKSISMNMRETCRGANRNFMVGWCLTRALNLIERRMSQKSYRKPRKYLIIGASYHLNNVFLNLHLDQWITCRHFGRRALLIWNQVWLDCHSWWRTLAYIIRGRPMHMYGLDIWNCLKSIGVLQEIVGAVGTPLEILAHCKRCWAQCQDIRNVEYNVKTL